MSEQILTAEQVGKRLALPRSTVYELARRGELPCVRIGQRTVRFRASSVDAWIEANERAGAPADRS